MSGTRARASSYSDTQHALIVGVDRLPNDWQPALKSPSRDAQAIASSLVRADGCAIPKTQVCLLTNEEATSSRIKDQLRHIASQLGPDDNLFVYFAGHGVDNGDEFFLLTADALSQRLPETSLCGRDVEEIFTNTTINGILFIVDCCDGGAAAEYAPNTFRQLRGGSYRILLASARPGQKSWETANGDGTFFSNELRQILAGKTAIPNSDGPIYFSDFVEQLDASIRERRELNGRTMPAQDMLFAGAYTKDPLLFVHRGLSLNAIEFQTARFSPKVVRRRMLQAVSYLAAAVIFLLISAYGILSASQYAVLEGSSITIYQGKLDFNLPGYPKHLWTLDHGPERLNGLDLPVVSALGENVIDQIRSDYRPIFRALDDFENQRSSEARTALLAISKDTGARPADRLNALLLIPSVSEVSDIPSLRLLLQHERREIQSAAFGALLRLSSHKDVLIVPPGVAPDQAEHQDIVRRLTGTCTEVYDAYLQDQFQSESNVPTNADLVDAAVRLGCPLTGEALARATLRPSFVGDEDIANFANLTGQSEDLADRLLSYLAQPGRETWSASTIFGTLTYLDQSPCLADRIAKPSELLAVGETTYRAALSKHCDDISLKIGWAEGAAVFTVSTDGADPELPTLVLDPNNDNGQLGIRFLLSIDAIEDDREVVQAISYLLAQPRSDDSVRAALIRTAIASGLRIDLPDDILDSNNLDVRHAVAEYERVKEESTFQERVLSRLGGQDGFYVELAGRAKLNAADLNELSGLLGEGPDAKRQAACVLGMQGSVERVIKLLSSLDAGIRSAALECATFNSEADKIASQFSGEVNGYLVGGWQEFLRQLRLRNDLEASLQLVPELLRPWRLRLINLTPGGFGLWNKGNRYWIREQQYMSSLVGRD